MSLGREARAILAAGRLREVPSETSRTRVRAALVARLGPEAALAAVPAQTGVHTPIGKAAASSWASTTAVKLVILGAFGGALGIAGYSVLHDPHRREVEPIAAVPHTEVAATTAAPAIPRSDVAGSVAALPTPEDFPRVPPPAPRRSGSAVTAISAPSTHTTAPSDPPAKDPVDALQGELALVRAAYGALRAGRPALALEKMDEHRRLYPTGALGEERDALRAEALCALGRAGASAEAHAFLEQHPASPFVARVRDACVR